MLKYSNYRIVNDVRDLHIDKLPRLYFSIQKLSACKTFPLDANLIKKVRDKRHKNNFIYLFISIVNATINRVKTSIFVVDAICH